MIFRIDFDKWVLMLLPTLLRRKVMFALCRATVAPIRVLYERFVAKREAHNYTLTHNGQVCYLRAALNDAFGTTGFDIVDYDDGRGEWLYAKSEELDHHLYAVDETLDDENNPVPILYDEARLSLPLNTFIVQVPAAIYSTNLDKVKGIVERYRPLSKQATYTMV